MNQTKVLRAYKEAALWSSTDEDGEPLDNYELSPETEASMADDVEDFLEAAEEISGFEDLDPAQVGHDFWLTRNRHGAGFWDRGLGALGSELTKLAHAYGGVDLYVGDDGLVYS